MRRGAWGPEGPTPRLKPQQEVSSSSVGSSDTASTLIIRERAKPCEGPCSEGCIWANGQGRSEALRRMDKHTHPGYGLQEFWGLSHLQGVGVASVPHKSALKPLGAQEALFSGDWAPRCPGVQAPSPEQESRTVREFWGRGRPGKPSLTWQISGRGGKAGTPVQGQMSGPPQTAVALAARWPPLPPVRALPSPSLRPGEGGKPPDLLPHSPAPSCCLLARLPPGAPARHLHRTLPHCCPAPRLPSPGPPWRQHMQSPLPRGQTPHSAISHPPTLAAPEFHCPGTCMASRSPLGQPHWAGSGAPSAWVSFRLSSVPPW